MKSIKTSLMFVGEQAGGSTDGKPSAALSSLRLLDAQKLTPVRFALYFLNLNQGRS
ncbi:MAG: hypothetical protein RIK85_06090 [Marinobacter sp.]